MYGKSLTVSTLKRTIAWSTLLTLRRKTIPNPDILLYLCSTAREQQAQRARLFSFWFRKAGQQERYYFKSIEVKGEEPGAKEYVAVIIPRNHPQAQEVLNFFDEETAMFNAMKPWGLIRPPVIDERWTVEITMTP